MWFGVTWVSRRTCSYDVVGVICRFSCVRSPTMYMTCCLSSTLPGASPWSHLISFPMPQVNSYASALECNCKSVMHVLSLFVVQTIPSFGRNFASDLCVCFDGTGNSDHVDALRAYLLSRSLARLKSEFQAGNGKVGLSKNVLTAFRKLIWLLCVLFYLRLRWTALKAIHQLTCS